LKTPLLVSILILSACNLSDEGPLTPSPDAGIKDTLERAEIDTCANGTLEETEECDGEDLNQQSCSTLGFQKGNLICSECHFDTRACATCGDGIRQEGEECDGQDFGDKTCQSEFMTEGELVCSSDCTTILSDACGQGYSKIKVGFNHTCALLENGQIECWGDNTFRQSMPPTGVFTELSLAADQSCAIKDDGSIHCWGKPFLSGQSPENGAFVQLSINRSHGCAVRIDGAIQCWGSNASGQSNPPLGPFLSVSAGREHSCGIKTNGKGICWGRPTTGTHIDETLVFSTIKARNNVSCGLKNDGRITCWGDTFPGTPPSGVYEKITMSRFNTVCGITTLGEVDCSRSSDSPFEGHPLSELSIDSHKCAIFKDRSVDCVDDNDNGQSIIPGDRFQSICVDGFQGGMCALRSDGRVKCWRMPSPPESTLFEKISCSRRTSAGLTPEKELIWWGSIETLGEIPNIKGIKEISAASRYVCAILENSTLACWGGANGVPSGKFKKVLALGVDEGCALSENDTIVCWGGDALFPPPAGKFKAIDGGSDLKCALRTDGELKCWGENFFNVPNGTYAYFTLPRNAETICTLKKSDGSIECWRNIGGLSPVPSPTGPFEAIDASSAATCAIRVDRTLECWDIY